MVPDICSSAITSEKPMTHLDIVAYLKVVKKEYCAFLQVLTNFSVVHCPVPGECAQPVCSQKILS